MKDKTTKGVTKAKAKCKTAKCAEKPVKVAKRRIAFTYRAEPGLKVFLAGSFNNWDPSAKEMKESKKSGIYSATMLLAPGSYEYKFVINGTWCADPECSDWVQNDHGTLNSVKLV